MFGVFDFSSQDAASTGSASVDHVAQSSRGGNEDTPTPSSGPPALPATRANRGDVLNAASPSNAGHDAHGSSVARSPTTTNHGGRVATSRPSRNRAAPILRAPRSRSSRSTHIENAIHSPTHSSGGPGGGQVTQANGIALLPLTPSSSTYHTAQAPTNAMAQQQSTANTAGDTSYFNSFLNADTDALLEYVASRGLNSTPILPSVQYNDLAVANPLPPTFVHPHCPEYLFNSAASPQVAASTPVAIPPNMATTNPVQPNSPYANTSPVHAAHQAQAQGSSSLTSLAPVSFTYPPTQPQPQGYGFTSSSVPQASGSNNPFGASSSSGRSQGQLQDNLDEWKLTNGLDAISLNIHLAKKMLKSRSLQNSQLLNLMLSIAKFLHNSTEAVLTKLSWKLFLFAPKLSSIQQDIEELLVEIDSIRLQSQVAFNGEATPSFPKVRTSVPENIADKLSALNECFMSYNLENATFIKEGLQVYFSLKEANQDIVGLHDCVHNFIDLQSEALAFNRSLERLILPRQQMYYYTPFVGQVGD